MLFQHIRKMPGTITTSAGRISMGEGGMIDTDNVPSHIDKQKIGMALAQNPDVFVPVKLKVGEAPGEDVSYKELVERAKALNVPYVNVKKADLMEAVTQAAAQAQAGGQ